MRSPFGLVLLMILIFFAVFPARADTVDSSAIDWLVISELQTGGSGSGTAVQEFVEIYNPTDSPIDIAGWKLEYKPATNTACDDNWANRIETEDGSNVLSGSVEPRGWFLIASQTYQETKPELAYDATLSSSGLSATGGHLRLVAVADNPDNPAETLDTVIDLVGWGTEAACAEGSLAATAPAGGESIKRIYDEDGQIQDQDNNSLDFIISTTPNPQSSTVIIIEEEEEIEEGTGDETSTEEESDAAPPEEETVSYLPIYLSELFIDPASPDTDADDEYIELYNPNDEAISLEGYLLETGNSFSYRFTLPAMLIEPGEFLTLYSEVTSLVLANSGGAARISDPNGIIIDSTDYDAAKVDEAWAFIDDTWEFTNRPTPSAGNLSSIVVTKSEETEEEKTAKTCAANQYLNPETNRCKKLAVSASLAACAADQYRNPETNRCKKLETDKASLKPCNPDQVRNPSTNRCIKKSSLAGFNDAGTGPDSPDFSTTESQSDLKEPNLRLVALTGGGALLYSLYEFRYDIRNRFQLVRGYLRFGLLRRKA